MSASTDYTAVVNHLIESRIPAMAGLGIRVQSLEPTVVVGVAPFAGNANHLDTMYAGTLFGLAEMLGGALFFSNFDGDRFYPTVKALTIDFVRPATSDVTGTASLAADEAARLRDLAESAGKAEFVIAAELTDSDGVVVAMTIGTYQLRRRRAARL